jgi:hypothetical protein
MASFKVILFQASKNTWLLKTGITPSLFALEKTPPADDIHWTNPGFGSPSFLPPPVRSFYRKASFSKASLPNRRRMGYQRHTGCACAASCWKMWKRRLDLEVGGTLNHPNEVPVSSNMAGQFPIDRGFMGNSSKKRDFLLPCLTTGGAQATWIGA